jgi:hypothetical protein
MSYTATCLVVHRTAPNQENLVGTGWFLTSHDRLGTVSGCWKLDVDRAASCAYLLVATDGIVVDVARILGAEFVPERWTRVSESDAAQGMKPIDANRAAVITAPVVPAPIETLIGQPIVMGRNPVRYVTVTVNGAVGAIDAADVVEEDQDRFSIYVDAAFGILAEVARTGGGKITYGSLGERIAETTGIEETRPLNWWIGDVLERLSRRNQENGEPLMSSMVVRTATGQVGPGYLDMLRNLLGEDPEDAEEHAALQRVRCQRYFTELADV